MTQGLLFGSPSGTGTRTRTSYTGPGINTSPAPSARGSISVIMVQFMSRILLRSPAPQKVLWRQRIAAFLIKARDSDHCIDALLLTCRVEGGPDGLDTAIDILAQTGELVVKYAWAYLQRDIATWSLTVDRAYKPNDDYWYILLRAVGRTNAGAKDRYRFIVCCASAQSRGVREGVIEGLRDLGTPAAKSRLEQFSKSDADRYIRELAQEAMADLES